jgi:hypothetical protein
MTTSLLTAKLFTRSLRPNLVPRACPIAKMGEGLADRAESCIRSSLGYDGSAIALR